MPLSEYLIFSTRLIVSVILLCGALIAILMVFDYEPNATKGVQAKTLYIQSKIFPYNTPDEEVYKNLFDWVKGSGAITRRELSNAKMDHGFSVVGEGSKQFVISVIVYEDAK